MAITSPKMGLKVWNLLTDPYDHAQLADNWAKVDQHDHTEGKGAQIPTGGIADGAITASKIDPTALPTLSLADNSVTTAKILNGAVTNAKLGTGSVTSGTILDGTIQTADIKAANVTTALVADDAITTAKLQDDAVVDANRAVTTNHIRDAAITSAKLGSTLAGYLGVNTSSTISRGYVSIAGNETTASTSFTKLTTPDQIANIVVPSNGKILVTYNALWKLVGATNAGAISIFLNGSEVTAFAINGAPTSMAATLPAAGSKYGYAATIPGGFAIGSSPTTDSTVVTTGMIMQPLEIGVAAGTYTVSVQWKVNAVTGGTLNAKNRQLWVEAVGY